VAATVGDALFNVATMPCTGNDAEADRDGHANDPNYGDGRVDAYEVHKAVHGRSPFSVTVAECTSHTCKGLARTRSHCAAGHLRSCRIFRSSARRMPGQHHTNRVLNLAHGAAAVHLAVREYAIRGNHLTRPPITHPVYWVLRVEPPNEVNGVGVMERQDVQRLFVPNRERMHCIECATRSLLLLVLAIRPPT
jgi:hypothetical protein